MREGNSDEVVQNKEHEPKMALGLVWVSCPHEEAILLIKEALGAKARVYGGKEPPQGEAPSSVVLCSNCEDVVQGMRRLRIQAPDVAVLVFGSTLEPRLAEEALRMGASGFIHAEMRPDRITLALSLASEGEIIIPRELLGELIGQRLFMKRPRLLDP
jgi:hypothetical protein